MEVNLCLEKAQGVAALEELLCLAALQLSCSKRERKKEKKKQKKRKTIWVRERLLQRTDFGQYEKRIKKKIYKESKRHVTTVCNLQTVQLLMKK